MTPKPPSSRRFAFVLMSPLLLAVPGIGYYAGSYEPPPTTAEAPPAVAKAIVYAPRQQIDTSGFSLVSPTLAPWTSETPIDKVVASWKAPGYMMIEKLDRELTRPGLAANDFAMLNLIKSSLLISEGETARAYDLIGQVRSSARGDVARNLLYSTIYFQGVAALRRGENDNCIMCRGESSCILPISSAAVHTNTLGSRTAIRHFTEYLEKFPGDLEVRWLLNVAHMTLGEYPAKVEPKYLVPIDHFVKSEFDIGRFRDIGHSAGVNRLNQAGGAIMEDFDNDGRLDLVATTMDLTEPVAFYHNTGDGTFEDRSATAGLSGEVGGLTCFQADYDNDGWMDVFIPRGAWLGTPMRPTLLRNDHGRFSDVTKEAGLLDPFNSNSACWADYDNDGFVDLFVACERQPNRLYRNRRDGTFEEVAGPSGLNGGPLMFTKGANWIDYDNDGAPDLFLNHLGGSAQLFHNGRDGAFTEVTVPMKINGPRNGFSCWAWDYDNDGWLDIFATSYDRSLGDVVKGLVGRPHGREFGRLFRNVRGQSFEDVTTAAGLDQVYAAMGSNFGDLDNDGFLDFYLGTGEPSIATLVPNRMFKNVGGRRFAEITGTSGTGHLQKGHGVAIGDWDADGDADVFIEMGGAVNGDKYHNILFENPGQGHHWLTVKLVGKTTNRAAIGARIKAVTGGDRPMTVHRHVTSGSSFGANPFRQTIGLAKSDRVATLEVYWPTSKSTQVFRDIPVDQAVEIVEFAENYRPITTSSAPASLAAGR